MENQNNIGKNEYWLEQDRKANQLFEEWQKQPTTADEMIKEHKEWEKMLKKLEQKSAKK
jgi:hypothetical protein